ncbi:PRD domain-containing protein, partial [Enterococcus sp. S181_ASV_20]|nr:PRD domain-containing protein [Enterococcus sp. S181_ASV_20]
TENNIQINQYSLNNIVLHFAISIERIRQGHSLKKSLNENPAQNSPEFLIAEEISNQLAQQYGIHFSHAELEQLLSLIHISEPT